MNDYGEYSYLTENDPKGKRGAYKEEITNVTQLLDALARIFAKNPYSAVIQAKDGANLDNNLYISLPARRRDDEVNDLTDDQVQHLKEAVITLMNNEDHNNKMNLFLLACKTNISSIKHLLTAELNSLDNEFIKVDPNKNRKRNQELEDHKRYVEDLLNPKNIHYFEGKISSTRARFLDNLLIRKFEEFLSTEELNSIRTLDILSKNFIRVPYEDYYQGVHVETKGVHFAQLKTRANEFYIGLGENTGNRNVGCCGKCCLEFNILEIDRDPSIIVYRTADYPNNIPDLYQPSPNLTQTERILFKKKNGMRGILDHHITKTMSLNQAISRAEQEIQIQKHEITNFKTNIDEKEQQNQELKKEIANAKKEVEDSQQQVKTLEERLTASIEREKQISIQLNEKEQQNQELKKEIANAKKEIEDSQLQAKTLEERLTASIEREKQVITQLNEKEQQNQELKKEITNAKKEIEDSQLQAKTLEERLTASIERERQVSIQLNEKEQQNQELKKEIANAKKKVEDSQHQARTLQERLATSIEREKQVSIQLTDKEKLIYSLREQLQEAEQRFNSQVQQNEQLIAESIELDNRYRHANRELYQTAASTISVEQEEMSNKLPPLKKRKLDNNSPKDQHLKQASKSTLIGDRKTYNFSESLSAANFNRGLPKHLDIKVIIETNIAPKYIDTLPNLSKNKATGQNFEVNGNTNLKNDTRSIGSIRIIAEDNHATDHARNIQSLITQVKAGEIDKDTIIALELKQYGENIGMKDVIKLAKVISHNEKHINDQEKQIKLPPEIIPQTLLYQDALLYKAAVEKGVKVIGLEGKNLAARKGSAEYNQNREQYMADVIHELNIKGYNVVANIGSAHKKQLEQRLADKIMQEKAGVGFSNLPRHLHKHVKIIRTLTQASPHSSLNAEKTPLSSNPINAKKNILPAAAKNKSNLSRTI